MRDGGGKLTTAELLEKLAEVEEATWEVSTGLPVSDAAEARVLLARQTVSAHEAASLRLEIQLREAVQGHGEFLGWTPD
jgi:hypothetical protein